MIKHITSLQNQLIKDIASLKNSSLKKSKNLFLIEGEDLVSLAYQEKQIDLSNKKSPHGQARKC